MHAAGPETESMDIGAAQCGQKAWSPSDKDIENMALICHEANRAVCVVNGDLSQPSWDDAPDWQKKSAIEGVKFHIAKPHADSRMSHDKWMETKLRDGWRYGPTKNADTKEHPCLLPYHALPDTEKVKDDIFKAVIQGYMAALKRKAFSL
jgi:hypothetical protein